MYKILSLVLVSSSTFLFSKSTLYTDIDDWRSNAELICITENFDSYPDQSFVGSTYDFGAFEMTFLENSPTATDTSVAGIASGNVQINLEQNDSLVIKFNREVNGFIASLRSPSTSNQIIMDYYSNQNLLGSYTYPAFKGTLLSGLIIDQSSEARITSIVIRLGSPSSSLGEFF